MANRATDLPRSDPRRARGQGRSRQQRRAAAGLIQATLALSLLSVSGAAAQPLATPDSGPVRRIVVSLQENRLWLTEGPDTLLAAPVAVGRQATFRHKSKVYNWETPRGERVVLEKRRDPVWHVPDWHYYERADRESLELIEMERGRRYALPDGSHLEVLGANVVRVLGGQYWKVPQGREIVIDGVLYAPPVGTVQRRVPGALGTRALDLGEGYLIHGTTPHNQSSIGSAASHGCIRMHTSDVERLFDLVDSGTPVLIY